MNSYPPELLAQLAPVMFVAGLDVPQTQPPEPFHTLIVRLRDALTAQRKIAIWQPDKSKSFHVVLVDKEVKFPPRKLVSPEDPQYASSHSSLSPLTPSSPLHPDGLIAPIWIRKHTTLVPSVFVMFLRLYEHPQQIPKSPLEGPDVDREREREAEERRCDTELSGEIANRKKANNDRNVKLTVVLLASRRMLDDPVLDARLTFIRRNSGLDSRAALFVLSPVSQSELGEFVKSLSQALYEPALDYYTSHSKRVRRKRNRHSTTVSSYANLPIGNVARPLRPEGWTVRYEYKMACFAEFRGEYEVALKHYQDAYDVLVIMFGSPAILPPRTKRWAEAKVLADTINIKITKLYLYNNETSLALSHHSTHIRKFGDFSRGWGIGEETYEFWSWTARQNRLLAELLEQATRFTLVIPVHKPQVLAADTLSSGQRIPGIDVDPRNVGLNPSHYLQHPGYYYYAGARCAEMRRVKFQTALEAEQNGQPTALSPGFTNEKKVDHNAIILELYTKAYELFKKHNPGDAANNGQGRLTLLIAYRIAQTYYNSEQFEMAIRFFERIARTYRREHWGSMLRPLLTTWHSCAKQLGDVELSIRLLLEMIGHDSPDEEYPTILEEDIVAVLESTVPKSPDTPFIVDLADAKPLFNTDTVFWSPSVKVGEAAAFQISLSAPTSVSISSLPISSLAVYLGDENDSPAVVIRHSPEMQIEKAEPVQLIDAGCIIPREPVEVNAKLQWGVGSIIVVTGTISSDVPTVSKLVLTLELNAWKIEIPLQPCAGRYGRPSFGKWLSSIIPPRFISVKRDQYSLTTVKSRSYQVDISLRHDAPALVDESYPIIIEIKNTDNTDLVVKVDILLQPTDADEAVNQITFEDERSSSLIKGAECGIIRPGESVSKTLELLGSGAPGDRVLDISVQIRVPDDDDQDTQAVNVTEKLQTIIVPTLEAFKVTQDVTYQHNLTKWNTLSDLMSYDEDYEDGGRGMEAMVITDINVAGPWPVYVEHVEFENDDARAELLDSSLETEDDDIFPGELCSEDGFNISSRFVVPTSENESETSSLSPGHYTIHWRRISENGERNQHPSVTRILIPSLNPPRENVIALLDVPPIAKLHVPLELNLSIRNYHPTLSANVLCQLEIDVEDAFVASGLKSGRIPILLPGAEEKITWRLIPMECGHVQLPKLKVFNRRKLISSSSTTQAQSTLDGSSGGGEGDVVNIVDIRRDRKSGSEKDPSSGNVGAGVGKDGLMSVLVLP
ncbi:hypothetical protein AGABI1DRAFT_37866 [Agaricus bisporus var. burnettii JB137-S8]|uniref:Trafficking protein particle complex subunit 11 n=1 Tax=Agaricus bisporus var. burnettii (strain JB137-S8 / ATCC MYA-4627 / FGSC 10392) TaxID=597362 RepID=K5W308_AGABU|nr:uncharacterized protein AGABI1DRAFT_37866 [Agaricus bisporus var. burnettii JB137-S8]EKM81164.1 hypothetical protein AGABI1DRAFT_37866 [Agaricus bisporus var. burnettii JB137-S8]